MQDVGVWIRAVAIFFDSSKLSTFSWILAAGTGMGTNTKFPFPGAAVFVPQAIKGANTVWKTSFSRHQLRQVLSNFERILGYIQLLFCELKSLNCKSNHAYIFTQISWTFE